MKTLTETLKGKENTNGYAMSINKAGMIPEVGETVVGGGQELICTAIDINADGKISIIFENGQKMVGAQLAKLQSQGLVNIK